jgi:hypothetical protein
MATAGSPPKLKQEPKEISLTHERLRLVIYGEYGVGKTTLAMTAPKPLVIDTNGGLISVAVESSPEEYIGDSWTPDDHTDLEALYFYLRSHADDYETIVIDSLDSLVRLLMDEIVDDSVERQRGKDKDPSLRMSYVPEQGDYFGNQRQMDRFLRDIRRLGKHVILTSGVRESQKAPIRRTPDVSPGARKIVQDWSSVTGELVLLDEGEDAGKRVLMTAPSGLRESKSRFRALLPYVLEPTFPKMWASIEAAYSNTDATNKETT